MRGLLPGFLLARSASARLRNSVYGSLFTPGGNDGSGASRHVHLGSSFPPPVGSYRYMPSRRAPASCSAAPSAPRLDAGGAVDTSPDAPWWSRMDRRARSASARSRPETGTAASGADVTSGETAAAFPPTSPSSPGAPAAAAAAETSASLPSTAGDGAATGIVAAGGGALGRTNAIQSPILRRRDPSGDTSTARLPTRLSTTVAGSPPIARRRLKLQMAETGTNPSAVIWLRRKKSWPRLYGEK
mmetsp:Transcript_3729/g.8310  ORF Transcript_3729/g.8310 Transcript_3729/m.8310 type:complete len:244 (-) Transcript_3729:670-1401(-)